MGTKCRNWECDRPAKIGWEHCSKECAPSGMYTGSSQRKPIESAETERSTFKEHGEDSTQFKNFAQRPKLVSDSTRTPSNTEQDETQDLRRSMTERKINTVSDGETGTHNKPQSIESDSSTEDSKELVVTTQLEESFKRSEIMEQDALTSINLIDTSVKQMHGLMLSLAEKVKAGSAEGKYMDLRQVTPVIQTAAEMRNLLRLKLDIWKEFRKNE